MKGLDWSVAHLYKACHAAPTKAKWVSITFLAVLCLLVLVRETTVGFYRVHGVSMTLALLPGDYVLADKTAFGDGLLVSLIDAMPSRGEIVIFSLHPGHKHHLIKRVVALPGDTLAMRNGRLRVNHGLLAEPYLRHATNVPGPSDAPSSWHFSYLLPKKQNHRYEPTGTDWEPLVVPEGGFFVLGDNRRTSDDSRDFGFVRTEELIARPIAFLK